MDPPTTKHASFDIYTGLVSEILARDGEAASQG